MRETIVPGRRSTENGSKNKACEGGSDRAYNSLEGWFLIECSPIAEQLNLIKNGEQFENNGAPLIHFFRRCWPARAQKAQRTRAHLEKGDKIGPSTPPQWTPFNFTNLSRRQSGAALISPDDIIFRCPVEIYLEVLGSEKNN